MGDMEIIDGGGTIENVNDIAIGGGDQAPKEEKETLNKEIIDKLDKTIFFSASAAKTKTDSVYKKKIEVQMLAIYNRINEAINNGAYYIDEISLTDGERKFLQSKGYGVTYLGTSNGKYKYKVYW